MARSIQFIVRAPLDMQNERIENTPGIASGSDLSISSMGDTTIDVGEVGARENLIINSDALDINAEGGITIDAGTGNNITFNSPVDLGNTSVIGIVVDARANGDHTIMPGDFFFLTPTSWYWNPDSGEERTITVAAGEFDGDVSSFGFVGVGDGGAATSNVPNPGAAGRYLRSSETAPGVYTWGIVEDIPNTHVDGLGNLAVASIVNVGSLPVSRSNFINQFSILVINSEHWYWNPNDTLTAKVLSTNADGNVFSFHEQDRDGNISNLTTITPAGDIDLIIAAIQTTDMIRIGDESGTTGVTDGRLPTPVNGQFLVGNSGGTGWNSVTSDVARTNLGLRDLATARVFDIPNIVSGFPGPSHEEDITIPADSLVYYGPRQWYFLPVGADPVVIMVTMGQIDSAFDPNSSIHDWLRIGDGHGETIRIFNAANTVPTDYENAAIIGGQGIDITVGPQTIGGTEYENVVNFQFDGGELTQPVISQNAIIGLDTSITAVTTSITNEIAARTAADAALRTDLDNDINHLSDTIANQTIAPILRRSGATFTFDAPTGAELITSTDNSEFVDEVFYNQNDRGTMTLSMIFVPTNATRDSAGVWSLTDDLGDGLGLRTIATLPSDASVTIGRYNVPSFGAPNPTTAPDFTGHPKFARWNGREFFYDLEIIGDDQWLVDNSDTPATTGPTEGQRFFATTAQLNSVLRNWRVLDVEPLNGVVTIREESGEEVASITQTTGAGSIVTVDNIPQILSADNVTATIPADPTQAIPAVAITLSGNDFTSVSKQYINGQPLTLYRRDGGTERRVFLRYGGLSTTVTNAIQALYISHEGNFGSEVTGTDWALYPGWSGTGSGAASTFAGRIRALAEHTDTSIGGFNANLNDIRVGLTGNLSLSPTNFNALSALGNLTSLTLDATGTLGGVIYQFKFKVTGTSTSVVPNTISGEVTYVNRALAAETATNRLNDWVVTFGGFAQEQPTLNVSNIPLTVGDFETAFDNDNNVRYFVEYTLTRSATSVQFGLYGQDITLNGGNPVDAGTHTESFLASSLNPGIIGDNHFATEPIYGSGGNNLRLRVTYGASDTENIFVNYAVGNGGRGVQFDTQEDLQNFITDKAEFRTNIGISQDNVELRAETNLPLISSALNTTTTYNLQGYRYHTTPGNRNLALDLNGRQVQTFAIDNGAFDFTFTLDSDEIEFIDDRLDLEVRLDPVAAGSPLRSITVTRIGSGSTNFTALPTVETEDNDFTRLSRIEFEDSGNTLRFVDSESGDRAFSPAPEMTVYTDLPLAVDDITAGTYNLAITRYKVTGANTEFNLVARGRDIETITIPGREGFFHRTFTITTDDITFWDSVLELDDLQLNSTLAGTTLDRISVGRLDTVVTGGGSTRLTATDPIFINSVDGSIDVRQFGLNQSGVVPGTSPGDNFRFLRGDGTWAAFAQVDDEFVIGENVIPRSDGQGYAPSTIENAIVDIISGTRFNYNSDNNFVTNGGNASAPKTITIPASLQADNEFRAAASASDTVTNSILVQVIENVTLDGPTGISDAVTILTPGYYIADNNGNINIRNVREITFETDDADNILRSIQSISNTPVTFPTSTQYNGRRIRGVWNMRPVQLADNWSNTIDIGPHERETNLLHSEADQVITPLIRLNGRVEISNDDGTSAVVIENGTITGSNLDIPTVEITEGDASTQLTNISWFTPNILRFTDIEGDTRDFSGGFADQQALEDFITDKVAFREDIGATGVINVSNMPATVGEFETAYDNDNTIQYFVEYTLHRDATRVQLELYGQDTNLNNNNPISAGTHTESFLADSLNPNLIGTNHFANEPIYGTDASQNLRLLVTYADGTEENIFFNPASGNGGRGIQFHNQQDLEDFITNDEEFRDAIGLNNIVSSVTGGTGITIAPTPSTTGGFTITAEGDGSLLDNVGDRFSTNDVSGTTLTPAQSGTFVPGFTSVGGLTTTTSIEITVPTTLDWVTGQTIQFGTTWETSPPGAETRTTTYQGRVGSYTGGTLVIDIPGSFWDRISGDLISSSGARNFMVTSIAPAGIQGPQGETGPRGNDGPQGIPGPMGLTGSTGNPGDRQVLIYTIVEGDTDPATGTVTAPSIDARIQGNVRLTQPNTFDNNANTGAIQTGRPIFNTTDATLSTWSLVRPDIETETQTRTDPTDSTTGGNSVYVSTAVFTYTNPIVGRLSTTWSIPYQVRDAGIPGATGPQGIPGRVREEMIMITQDLNPPVDDNETGITDAGDATWDGRIVVGETYLVVNDSADLEEGREIGGFVSIFCYDGTGNLVQAASGIVVASSETLGADTVRNWGVQITGVQMALADGATFETGMIDLAVSGPQGMQGVQGDSVFTNIKQNVSVTNQRIGLQVTTTGYDFDLEPSGATAGVTVRRTPQGTDHLTRLAESIDWLLYTSTPASGIVSDTVVLVTVDSNADSPLLGRLLTTTERDALETSVRANMTFVDIPRIQYTGNRRIEGTWYQFIGLDRSTNPELWIQGDGQVFSLGHETPAQSTDDTIIV